MRFAVLMMTGALVFAAPAFAQPASPAAEVEAPAVTTEAAPAEAAPAEAAPAATPEAEDRMICREVQNVGSRMRSQRTRTCMPASRWAREDADMRRQYDRAANSGQAMTPPSGRPGM